MTGGGRRGMRRVVPAVAAALAALAVLTGCTADVTQPKVQQAFARAFRRLYVQQLHLLGKPQPAPLLRQIGNTRRLREAGFYTQARCHKGARHSPQTGAGDGWTCIEYFQRSSGAVAQADYEVSVRTDGCFVASGPAQVVGPPQIVGANGQSVVNPLSQFYACFPT
jgi:hypothetical protein